LSHFYPLLPTIVPRLTALRFVCVHLTCPNRDNDHCVSRVSQRDVPSLAAIA
jgi:hypothetical protein